MDCQMEGKAIPVIAAIYLAIAVYFAYKDVLYAATAERYHHIPVPPQLHVHVLMKHMGTDATDVTLRYNIPTICNLECHLHVNILNTSHIFHRCHPNDSSTTLTAAPRPRRTWTP